MRLSPEIIDGGRGAAPVAAPFAALIENAIVARAPFAAPYLPLISKVARFLAVGVIGLAVDSGVFAFLFADGASAPVARAVSLAIATLATWILNRLITFGPSGRAPLVEMARYFGVACVAQGFNYGVFLALHYAAGETRPFACLFAAAALTAVFSFTGQSAIAFARSPVPRMNS